MSLERSTATPDLQAVAERALERMRAQGFEQAQVSAGLSALTELNVAHNEPSLLRSGVQHRIALVGIVDARKAGTELGTLDVEAVDERIAGLLAEALSAPRDEAHAVSFGEQASVEHGPRQGDEALIAETVADLLAFRERETPRMIIDEAFASHTAFDSVLLTSGGSALACRLGWYSVSVFGTAREGGRSSSFNYTGGDTHDLAGQPARALFGIEDMLRETERQIETQRLSQLFGGKFEGEVVLSPHAVLDLLQWLQGQLSDTQLIARSSLYRDRVGEIIASPLLTLASRFDAPGVAAISADGFATPPLIVLREGRLETLTPSLYGSRKTGLPHRPTAGAGWALEAGETAREQVVAGVKRGALVGRLSMGRPAPNGDFSAVIKNSFAIEGGALGPALSETMAAGNMARMLKDVTAVSRERIDFGGWCLPWLRIGGLFFS